jgi:hypothetical protein
MFVALIPASRIRVADKSKCYWCEKDTDMRIRLKPPNSTKGIISQVVCTPCWNAIRLAGSAE